jgi:hypothetical protein
MQLTLSKRTWLRALITFQLNLSIREGCHKKDLYEMLSEFWEHKLDLGRLNYGV